MDTDGAVARSLSYESKRRIADSALVFVFGVLIFTLALPPEFIGLQARFAVFAQEMLRNGPSFFPTVYGHPYPDYPATSTFLVYLASLPFGRVTPFSAVLPSAMASALVLVLTYRVGALRSRRWGLAAAMFAVVTVEFLGDARNTTLDQYTSLATVLSFYLVYSAARLGRPRRQWLLPLAWIFGFASRGPLGLVIPVAVVCSYYLWNVRFKQLILAAAAGAILLALCMKGLLIAAAMQGGQALASSVLSSQMTGRIDDRGQGFSYYWLHCLISYALTYPIAVMIVACRFKSIVHKATDDDKLLGSLTAWVLMVLVGMSIPSAKHIRYLLPIVPATSLIAAYLLVDASPKGALLAARRVFEQVCSSILLPIALAIAAVVLIGLNRNLCYVVTFGASVLLMVLSIRLPPRPLQQAMRSLGFCAAVFVIVIIGLTDPTNYDLEKTGPFVRRVEAMQADHPGDIVFLDMGPDQEDVKFVANASKPIEPHFAASSADLEQWTGGPYIITDEQAFQALPPDIAGRAHLLLRGKIGHENCVVFILAPPQG